MAKKKRPPATRAAARTSKPAAAAPAAPPSTGPRRDARPYVYVALDLVFAAVYAVVVTKLAPNRHAWAQTLLLGLPVAAFLMGAGTLVARLGRGTPWARRAWWLAIGGAALQILLTVVLLGLLLASAAFLSGVYGAFGKAAASGMLAAAAIIVEIVGLLPVFQLSYLLGRGGRRAFGLTPRQAAA
ncbi:MAG: hypothetical protein H6709_03675 [Kofleriaceae bacterium]|nr:hypothetical protein [Kofleriaceae bacterium]MCB9571169.1 hypothetical protein [Kofleriaceae bacterium]